MGSHFLLQGIVLTQESNLHLLNRQADSLPSHLGSPAIKLHFYKSNLFLKALLKFISSLKASLFSLNNIFLESSISISSLTSHLPFYKQLDRRSHMACPVFCMWQTNICQKQMSGYSYAIRVPKRMLPTSYFSIRSIM